MMSQQVGAQSMTKTAASQVHSRTKIETTNTRPVCPLPQPLLGRVLCHATSHTTVGGGHERSHCISASATIASHACDPRRSQIHLQALAQALDTLRNLEHDTN